MNVTNIIISSPVAQELIDLMQVIATTFKVSALALAISTIAGIPTGAFVALVQFQGRRLARAILYTGMGLPPVIVGLAVYVSFSRSGPFGELNWLFRPSSMIVAQIIIAFPLIAGLTTTAVESVDPQLRMHARSLGASQIQEGLLLLREAQSGVIAAILAGFGGIISEVGAAMLVGGNIEGQTRVLSTAIVLETRQGSFGIALALGGVLLALAFAVNAFFLMLQKPGRSLKR